MNILDPESPNSDKSNLFTPQKKESAVDLVINNIKKLLLTKHLMPGDRLPNELELSKNLQVSRGSIREAMKILSAFGIIDIRQGDGTYIAESPNKVLFDPLLFNLILAQSDFNELMELREIMEFEVIRLIIKNADEDAIKLIENAYLDMETKINSSVKDPVVLSKSDLEFHYALGKATKNKLVEKIYTFIMDFFMPSIEITHEAQKTGLSALHTHKKILDALMERDLEKAIDSIFESIKVWQQLYSQDGINNINKSTDEV
ncbi:FadR/GntR family transcriptional regulator [Petroclostridium sp. X23]|uniref:FadR/GntR family transcriptional regulator n=1 Tax=Petroclostridium sp. X23 TaxID=3045146 RepID=UPI0024ACDF78|nr:FadR/GntR family transcriptional regulator [Petroclostridium sp. X23]WHH58152.1 FadR/GntR family transcriptional regulator [Petroclostridium sp. X23]